MGDAQDLRRCWIVFKGLPLFLLLKHSTSLRAAEHCGTANRSRLSPLLQERQQMTSGTDISAVRPREESKILQASRKSLPESKAKVLLQPLQLGQNILRTERKESAT